MSSFSRSGVRWLAPALFLAALAAAYWRAPAPEPTLFVAPPPPSESSLPALFSSEMLPRAAASGHAASLAQLADGRLAAAWFAGTKEGADDVAIWFSVADSGRWTPPRAIATRDFTTQGTGAYVRKIGNPVLHAEGDKLHLWYVSAAVGGWACSSINHSISTDGGETWSPPVRLQTSPFINISTLVRTPPLPLADGGLGLPVYHELRSKHGEWLRLAADGQIVDKVRMTHSRRTLQPAVVALDAQRAVAVLRDAGRGAGNVQRMLSTDAGSHWSEAVALDVPNPNSSVALLRLPGGRLLLAGNPQNGRSALMLWLSDDEGETWQASRTIETSTDPNAEFSYPALLLGSDGMIHLAYTWFREGIKHASFSEAWLDAKLQ